MLCPQLKTNLQHQIAFRRYFSSNSRNRTLNTYVKNNFDGLINLFNEKLNVGGLFIKNEMIKNENVPNMISSKSYTLCCQENKNIFEIKSNLSNEEIEKIIFSVLQEGKDIYNEGRPFGKSSNGDEFILINLLSEYKNDFDEEMYFTVSIPKNIILDIDKLHSNPTNSEFN